MSTEEKIHDSPSGDNSPPPENASEIERELQQVNEKSLLRKIDAQLLPAVGILYLLSFLDRSNGKVQDIGTRVKFVLTSNQWAMLESRVSLKM